MGRTKCGEKFSRDTTKTCFRPQGHYGLHRDKFKVSSSTTWGDNECYRPPTPEQIAYLAELEKTLAEIKSAPPVEYSVKIWYKSDTYEGVSHCPEELARKIYREAAASEGVEFAELHGPSGKLVESKVPHNLTQTP